jgi:2-methylcitrate dehydratase
VECRERKEYTDLYGVSYPNRITILMNNGEVHAKEIKDPKGHPLNPLDRSQIERKFRMNSDGILNGTQQDRLIRSVWDLEKLDDLKPLMNCMVMQ